MNIPARPQQIYERPVNEFVAGFVRTTNVLEGATDGNRIDLGFIGMPIDCPLIRDRDTTDVIRPEEITVGDCYIKTRVTDIYYFSGTVQTTAEPPDRQELSITLDKSRGGLSKDETISLGLDTG